MKKRNVFLSSILAVAVLGLLAAGVGNARPYGERDHERHHSGGEHHGMQRGGDLRHLLKRLDLSEEQRDQIFELKHAQRPAMRDKVKELRQGRSALRAAAMAKDYDARQVRQLADAQAKLIADLMVMRTETFHRIYGLLTPEQQQKLAEWKDKRRGHFGRE